MNPTSAYRPVLLVGILAAAAANLSASPASAQTAAPSPDVVDARYGPDPRHTLDLWKAPSSRPTPTIVFFHGGGFAQGSKDGVQTSAAVMLKNALKAGVSFAAVNYRYAKDGASLPAPMQDGARAIQFLRYRAAEWNLDQTKMAAYGVSAGAVIALWIGFHDDLRKPESADPVERQSSRLTVVGSVNGQTSCDPRFLRSLLGPSPDNLAMIEGLYGGSGTTRKDAEALYVASSPLTYLTGDDPPVFTYYRYALGSVPPTGPGYIHHPRFGVDLKKRMDRLGIECVFRHLGDLAGGDRADAKGLARERGDQQMLAFFVRYLLASGGNTR